MGLVVLKMELTEVSPGMSFFSPLVKRAIAKVIRLLKVVVSLPLRK